MKRIFLLAVALIAFQAVQAQGFSLGFSGGFLTELDGIGGTADAVYEITEKWSAASDFTYAVAEESGVRSKWSIVSLNVRFKVYDEFYLLGGGQYLSVNVKELGLGGGNPISSGRILSGNDFGANAGAGYIYNVMDNVNIFAEVRSVFMDNSYVHARLGVLFDL